MFKVIGKYGSFFRYQIDLGEYSNLDEIIVGVIDILNSLRPNKKIFMFVYKDSELIGRVVDNREIDIFGNFEGDIPLVFLNNEEFKEWQKKRSELLNSLFRRLNE